MASGQTAFAGMLIGTAVSFLLHGISCGQVLWYYRFLSSNNSKSMNALVCFIWIGETLNCVLAFLATLHTFLAPAIVRAHPLYSDPCRYWTGPSQVLTSSICTFSVEGFFIIRMWRFSGKKKLLALAFIPYIVGQGFSFAQVIRSFSVRCNPAVEEDNLVFTVGTFSCRLFGDGIVVATMCYMLHVRSLGLARHANTIRIVRRLILWSISTGLLTWLCSMLSLISYVASLPYGLGLYYVRCGLYTITMFAQLNARIQLRAIAEESIPLSPLNLMSQCNHSQPEDVNR